MGLASDSTCVEAKASADGRETRDQFLQEHLCLELSLKLS